MIDLLTCDLPVAAVCRRFGAVVVVDRIQREEEDYPFPYWILRVVVPRERAWRDIDLQEATALSPQWTDRYGLRIVADIGREYAACEIGPATGPFFKI